MARPTFRRLLDQGWSCIPFDTFRRVPATICGRMLRFADYAETPPTPDEADQWDAEWMAADIAMVLGPASGHTFAITATTPDDIHRAYIEDCIETHLDRTPLSFRAEDSTTWIYRRAPEEHTLNSSYTFDIPGEWADFDLLFHRRCIAIASPDLTWSGPTPADLRPTDLEVVTMERLERAMVEIECLHSFVRDPALKARHIDLS